MRLEIRRIIKYTLS